MSHCPPSSLRPRPAADALSLFGADVPRAQAFGVALPTASVRGVLVVGARRPELVALARTLRSAGFAPSLAYTGDQALRRIVEEPVPSLLLVHWAAPGEGTAHWLQVLQHAGALGWFSLVVLGGGELPPHLHAQARLASDCSADQLLEVLETLSD
ncbi:hypothetical protein FGE12_27860 [Aggregicoccus sp. 17bor-14]|uniref:hypothetical protein n=1 Tax=Myxococcaceae TaxID=31 RepID=UPI00129D1FD8|nr:MULTISPECIES: hypothetical protein [Myxococcaceae]MBF5046264.1 hypothetical protein [Simulacricoccus sp. 17bor-14]MRI91986.1 hypothetical protein [Aggregicoccus sp. 17bor-14]